MGAKELASREEGAGVWKPRLAGAKKGLRE
jgi:hypothetical protein